MKCPYCGKEAKTERGLIRHLTGTKKYGGHDLTDGVARAIARGGFAPPLDGSRLLSDQAPRKAPMPVARSRPGGRVHARPCPSFCSSPTGDFLLDFFSTIASNKELPKYQFERRVDAVLAIFLPDILAATYGWRIEVVVPEFPIKRADSNQTTNADYALFRHSGPSIRAAWILFELKTDATSIRDIQLRTYLKAREKGMRGLRRELEAVREATKHRQKYARLLERVDTFPVDAPIEILYLTPGNSGDELQHDGVHVLGFGDLTDLRLPNYTEAWDAFRAAVLPVLC